MTARCADRVRRAACLPCRRTQRHPLRRARKPQSGLPCCAISQAAATCGPNWEGLRIWPPRSTRSGRSRARMTTPGNAGSRSCRQRDKFGRCRAGDRRTGLAGARPAWRRSPARDDSRRAAAIACLSEKPLQPSLRGAGRPAVPHIRLVAATVDRCGPDGFRCQADECRARRGLCRFRAFQPHVPSDVRATGVGSDHDLMAGRTQVGVSFSCFVQAHLREPSYGTDAPTAHRRHLALACTERTSQWNFLSD